MKICFRHSRSNSCFAKENLNLCMAQNKERTAPILDTGSRNSLVSLPPQTFPFTKTIVGVSLEKSSKATLKDYCQKTPTTRKLH